MNNKFIVLIPCAGSGARFSSGIPKQYTMLDDKTVLEHTLNAFLSVPLIDKVVIIVNPSDTYIDSYLNISPKINIQRVGGSSRALSVTNALKQLKCEGNDWILVHDAARCCITPKLIYKLIHQIQHDAVGGILAISATDTIKVGINGVIENTLPRNQIFMAQTPQMFRYKILLQALNESMDELVTDESSAVEQLGFKIRLIEGDITNIKLTYQQDIQIAKIFLGG